MNFGQISLLMQQKKYPQALRLLLRLPVPVYNVHNEKIQYYKALCYSNTKNYSKALEMFDFVLSSKIGFVYYYQCKMICGYIYTEIKKFNLAELEFLDLVQNGYESSRVYASLGHVAYLLGKKEEAVRTIQKALKLNSDNATALNSLSYILAENGNNLPVALQLAKKALNISPNSPAYLDTYGLILYKLKRYRESKKILEQAYRISANPIIFSHIELINKVRKKVQV